jgi:hypothetical protein
MSRQIILVPQGAEYQAVCRGVQRASQGIQPQIIAIPIGIAAVTNFLQMTNLQAADLQTEQEKSSQQAEQPSEVSLLVLGLCGSLTTEYGVGDAVLYRECVGATGETVLTCAPTLTADLQQRLNLPIVRAVTCDRVIHLSAEKRAIADSTAAAVVDMEGLAVLQSCPKISVAMLRVVSDDCQHDLPDLSAAFSSEGKLLAGNLTIALLRRPLAALRLIRASLRGLRKLEALACSLVQASGVS